MPMTRMFNLIRGGLLIFTAATAAEPAPKRPIAVDDLSAIRTVSDPRRSPDGAWVVYVVSTVDVEKDKTDKNLWMVPWTGGDSIQLTFTTDADESQPRWSPDGRFISFLSKRGSDEEKKNGAQIWLLDRRGGEARAISESKSGISDHAWSPDGSRIVYVETDKDLDEEPEKKEGWKRKSPPPIVLDRFRFKKDVDGYIKALYSHLWILDVKTRKSELLTSGAFDDRDPAWSPDGTRIAFVSQREKGSDRTGEASLNVVDSKAGSEPRQIASRVCPESGPPAWSPDGRFVAYIRGDEPKFYAYHLGKLAVAPAAGGDVRVVTERLDRGVAGPISWASDGQTMVFTVADDRSEYAARIPLAVGPLEKLTDMGRVAADVTLGIDGALTLLSQSAVECAEVHAMERGNLRRLTHHNDTLLAGLQLGKTEEFTSKSKDGTEVHSLLTKPFDAVDGKRYPLVLLIHGGPNGHDRHAFNIGREFLAAHGYAVLAVNYRGSLGRGDAYQKAIFANWGNLEVMDLLGAVDRAVELGIADPQRLGIGGWSYGGILTDYTIASDTRFKAAISGAGSALQLSMYGSDEYVQQYDLELGPPWKSKDLWVKLSYPFFQADRIRTPTLFLCGEKDFNVPVIGSEQMYQALKSVGTETQLVVYPGQYHHLDKPSYERDRLARYLAWFDSHLKAVGR